MHDLAESLCFFGPRAKAKATDKALGFRPGKDTDMGKGRRKAGEGEIPQQAKGDKCGHEGCSCKATAHMTYGCEGFTLRYFWMTEYIVCLY